MNSSIRKRFSILGLLAALAATAIFALAVILTVVWTDGFQSLNNFPNLPITLLLTVPAISGYFAWSYFVTGKIAHGWIVTALFAGFGAPLVILGIHDAFNPPPRHEMITLEVSHASFAVVYSVPLLLSAGLFAELRKRKTQE